MLGGRPASFVTTTDGSKKMQRGMTQSHPTFEEAKAALTKLATDAEGLGWSRRTAGRGFSPRPDAFSALPAAPVKGSTGPKAVTRKSWACGPASWGPGRTSFCLRKQIGV